MASATTYVSAADKWPLKPEQVTVVKGLVKGSLPTAKYDADAEWYRSTADKPVFFKAGTYTDHTDATVRSIAQTLHSVHKFSAGQVASALGLQYSHLARLAFSAKPAKKAAAKAPAAAPAPAGSRPAKRAAKAAAEAAA